MKRIIIFVVVGLIVFCVGLGGGVVLGRVMAPKDNEPVATAKTLGPIVSVGEFTANLAGAGRHVVSFSLSFEVIDKEAAIATLNDPRWAVQIRNNILLLAKDKVYEDLSSAEGTLQFAEEIKRNVNAILPTVANEAPVMQVLFESIVLQ